MCGLGDGEVLEQKVSRDGVDKIQEQKGVY